MDVDHVLLPFIVLLNRLFPSASFRKSTLRGIGANRLCKLAMQYRPLDLGGPISLFLKLLLDDPYRRIKAGLCQLKSSL
jgi:hypothetical protein